MLTKTIESSAGHGSASFTSGALNYTPAQNYNGTDTFTIKINDGHGGIVYQEVNLTVIPENDAPTLNSNSVEGIYYDGYLQFGDSQSATIDLTEVFTDAESDTLIYSFSSSSSGNISVSSSGSYIMITGSYSSGSMPVQLKASDNNGASWVTHIVNVTINNSVIPDQFINLNTGDYDVSFSLSGYFETGADSVYTAESENENIDITISDDMITISAATFVELELEAAIITITVTASDGHGGKVSGTFLLEAGYFN